MPMMLKSMIKMTSLGLFFVPALAMAQDGNSSQATTSTKTDNRPTISQEEYEPVPPPTAEQIESAKSPEQVQSLAEKELNNFANEAQSFGEDIKDVISTMTSGRIAAFIAEPIQGVGGFITLPPEWLQAAAEIAREYEGLVIIDEVQTGFGRRDAWTLSQGVFTSAAICRFYTVVEGLAWRVKKFRWYKKKTPAEVIRT